MGETYVISIGWSWTNIMNAYSSISYENGYRYTFIYRKDNLFEYVVTILNILTYCAQS